MLFFWSAEKRTGEIVGVCSLQLGFMSIFKCSRWGYDEKFSWGPVKAMEIVRETKRPQLPGLNLPIPSPAPGTVDSVCTFWKPGEHCPSMRPAVSGSAAFVLLAPFPETCCQPSGLGPGALLSLSHALSSSRQPHCCRRCYEPVGVCMQGEAHWTQRQRAGVSVCPRSHSLGSTQPTAEPSPPAGRLREVSPQAPQS